MRSDFSLPTPNRKRFALRTVYDERQLRGNISAGLLTTNVFGPWQETSLE